jgi:hypothetical protein
MPEGKYLHQGGINEPSSRKNQEKDKFNILPE